MNTENRTRLSRLIKVTLSGCAGSGKSTVGQLLASELGVEFCSVGGFARAEAVKRGMDINAFQEYLKTHPEFDLELDRHFQRIMREKPAYVLDYRLGFHFLPDSFRVLLLVSDHVALQRMGGRSGADENLKDSSPEAQLATLLQRNLNMRERFLKTYQVDFMDSGHYDLVIQTDQLTPDQIVARILESIFEETL